MKLGNQTAHVVTVTEDLTAERDRYGRPPQIRTTVAVKGCRCRPLPAVEKIETGDVVTDPWRLTAPPVEAIIALQANDEVQVDGIVYSVVGLPRVFSDLHGRPHKVTVQLNRYLS